MRILKTAIATCSVLVAVLVSCTTTVQKGTADNEAATATVDTTLDVFSAKLGLNHPLPASFVNTLLSVSEPVGIDGLLKDFSFDTLTSTNGADLVFCNNRIVEGFVTYVFSHDDDYSEAYRHAGRLVDVVRKDSVLVIVDPDCCAGNNLRRLFVSYAGKKFQNRYCIYSIVDMQWPACDEALPVVTVVDSAAMRMAPVVDDSTYNYDLHGNGNSIGKFPIQTSGVSLSVEADTLGQKWAFVLLKDPPCDYTHVWSIGESGYGLFAGWMRCRDLSFDAGRDTGLPGYLTESLK